MTSDEYGSAILKLSEVEDKVRLLASIFQDRFKLNLDHVVHILLPNTTEFYFPVLATWLAGGVVSLGDPTLNTETLVTQLVDTQAKLVIGTVSNSDKIIEAVAKAGTDTKVICLGNPGNNGDDQDQSIHQYQELLASSTLNPDFRAPVPGLDSRAMVLWSSGTTGRPKAIQHMCVLYMEMVKTKPKSVETMLQTTCFFHTGGFLTPLLILGADYGRTCFFPVESVEAFEDAVKILKAIDKYKGQGLMTGTHHAMRLARLSVVPQDLDLSPMLFVMPVGSTVPHDTADKLSQLFPKLMQVANYYGMTEFFASVAHSTTPQNIGASAPMSLSRLLILTLRNHWDLTKLVKSWSSVPRPP